MKRLPLQNSQMIFPIDGVFCVEMFLLKQKQF